MNVEQFKNSPSGQLVQVGRGEAACWAFVPHPLPPLLPADWALGRRVSAADRALGELAGLGRTMPNPHLLIGPFVRREAVLSSHRGHTGGHCRPVRLRGRATAPARHGASGRTSRRARSAQLCASAGIRVAAAEHFFFLHGIAEQAQDAIVRARRLQDLQSEWRERLTQARASTLLLRLADSLFASPILTIPEAQRRLGVTYPSAQRNVDRLVAAGILRQDSEATYGRTFVAAEILEVIGEP